MQIKMVDPDAMTSSKFSVYFPEISFDFKEIRRAEIIKAKNQLAIQSLDLCLENHVYW